MVGRSSRRIGLGAVLALSIALLPQLALAAAGKTAKVTFAEGEAAVLRGGDASKREKLDVGATVASGDVVTTGANGLLELTMPDKSAVRVGSSSQLAVEKLKFDEAGERSFGARLSFGSVWSKVSTVLGGDAKFEVTTDNAVAGVRGTTFRVDARADKSVVVSVFAGSVAVGKGGPVAAPHTPGVRKEKAGPKEVSKSEWEKLVLTMMKIKVAADGTAGEPEKVVDGDIDDFARFNQKRDG